MALPVSHIMRAKVAFCEETTPLRKVAERMLSENLGSILVRRGEEAVGIITTNDLVRAALKTLDFDKTDARQIMSQPLETCDSEHNLDQALKLFDSTGRSRLVVKSGDKVVDHHLRTSMHRNVWKNDKVRYPVGNPVLVG